MQNNEKENNTNQSQNLVPSTSNLKQNHKPEKAAPEGKKEYKYKYTALITLLKRQLTSKEYKMEIGVITKIVKLGFTYKEIEAAWNYYESKKRGYTSFKIFLWEKGKLISDIKNLLVEQPKEVIKLEDADYRKNKNCEYKQTLFDFLSDK